MIFLDKWIWSVEKVEKLGPHRFLAFARVLAKYPNAVFTLLIKY